MIIHELEITTDDNDVILTQPNIEYERTEDVRLSLDQIPMVIAELQRLYDERNGT